MFCTKCGIKLRDTAKFCKNCGAPVDRLRTLGDSASGSPSLTGPPTYGPDQFLSRAKERFLGYTQPKVESTRRSVVEKIDHFVDDLGDPAQFRPLSSTQRESLAQALANLKSKISKDTATQAETQQAMEMSEELLAQLKDDRCLVCYKKIAPAEGERVSVAVCPNCGHGGHQEHVLPWFTSKETCPSCKTPVKPSDLLYLQLDGQ